jgi:ketosteroid isomerase-like protein
MNDVERFLDRFRAFGRAPAPEVYEQLFDPVDGTVLHPGMPAPLPVRQVRAYMATYLAAIPDFRFEVQGWAERDGTVFVEARNGGTVGGEALAWNTVYCVTLRGDRVLRGRAYGDRVPLLARLMPEMTLAQAASLGAPAPGLDVGAGNEGHAA